MLQQRKAYYKKNREKSGIMKKFIEISILKKLDMKHRAKYKNCSMNQKMHSQNFSMVNIFLMLSKKGSTLVCVIFNRCLYLKTMLGFKLNKYHFDLAGLYIKFSIIQKAIYAKHAIFPLRNYVYQLKLFVIGCIFFLLHQN